jgi:hypothetical protein
MGAVAGIRFGVSTSEQYDAEKQKVDSEHTATYVVIMQTEAAREPDVAATPGVPFIGSASPININARCVSRDITEIGPCTWEVTCTFSTNYRTEPSDEFPWERLPSWLWGTESVEEPLLCDAQDDTKGILNSAREPLIPPTSPIAVPVLTISRYESTFTPNTILAYVNKVNSASFWGAAANQAFMAGINATQEILDGWRVWKATYTIKFKIDSRGWRMRLLDQGTYYWTGTVGSSEKKPFGDRAFQQVVGNLNGSGGQNTTASPSFVTYNRYDDADFNQLQLGPWNT